MAAAKPSRGLTLVDLVRQALGADTSDSGVKAVKVRKAVEHKVDEEELRARVGSLLADRDFARIGQLHIIGFERVSAHFGDEWESLAPKARQIAEGVLRSHLSPADIVVAIGDLGYLMLFETRSEDKGDVKAAMIAAGIANRLLGGIQQAAEVSTVSVTESADGEIEFQERSVLDIAGNLLAEEIARKDGRAANAALSPRGPMWTEAEKSHGHVDDSDIDAGDEGVDETSQVDLGFFYNPIWDVRRKVLSTYRCVPARRDSRGQTVFGYAVFPHDEATDAYLHLDMLTMHTVTRTLKELHKRKRRVLMVTPVHYLTLLHSNEFAKWKMFFQSIPDDVRRDMSLTLMGTPDIMAEPRAIDIFSALKTMCRSVVAPVRLERTHFEALMAGGIDTIATNIGDVDGGESRIMEMMDSFAEGANQMGLHTVAYGLESLNLVTLAVAAGFDYLEGQAVHVPLENPEHVFRFRSEDLFAKLVGRD